MFSSSTRRLIQLITAGLVLLSAAGCVRETTNQDDHVFQYEFWIPLGVLFLGIAAGAGGFFVRKYNARAGWVLIIMGPLAALGFAPSLYLERTVVHKDGFEMHTGWWGQTVVPTVQFADLSGIRVSSETRRTRRGRRTNYFVNCDQKGGGSIKVPVNNDVAKAAAKLIVQEAMDRKIPFRDETDNP